MRLKNNKFVLTVSYGNYTEGTGGTDKVILAHQDMLNQAGISVVHIYPVSYIYDRTPKIFLWGLLVDGMYKGLFVTEQILRLMKKYCSYAAFRAVFIHHFNRIQIEEINTLLSNIDANIYFYLHDYMSICPEAGLVYNKTHFCCNVSMSEQNCKGCTFYSEAAQLRAEKIEKLLQRFQKRMTVIAPSPTAAEVWLRHYGGFKDQIKVIYHQKPNGFYRGNKQMVPPEQPLRIAFVGAQKKIKGWSHWFEAVENARKAGCNYVYYQFGTVKNHYDYINEVTIDFKESLTAMTDALREQQIDCAVLWSIWPETYSYTYYEAFSANCFVITNDLSGNIAFQVKQNGNGVVLNGEESLAKYLTDEPSLRRKVNDFKASAVCGSNALSENDELIEMLNGVCGSIEMKEKVNAGKAIKALNYNLYKSHYENTEKRRIFLYRHYHKMKDRIKKH